MRRLLFAIASMLLCVGVTACAGAGRHTGSGSSEISGGVSTRGYLNDGDVEQFYDEDADDSDRNRDDKDGDSSREYSHTYDNGGYHDGDDRGVLTFGHAASSADTRAIAAVVERFYAAAAAGEGATACASMVSSVARAVPNDYRQAPGPSYLYGGRTCRAVMSRAFKYLRREMTFAVEVSGARVNGDEGIALLGSRTMPASEIRVRREHGVWKIDALFGAALP
jgi:hypothetical protein